MYSHVSLVLIFALLSLFTNISAVDRDEVLNDHVWTPNTSEDSPTLSRFDDVIYWHHQQNPCSCPVTESEVINAHLEPPSFTVRHGQREEISSESDSDHSLGQDRDPSILKDFVPYYTHADSEEDDISNMLENVRIQEDARDPVRGRTAVGRARHQARVLRRRQRRAPLLMMARMNRDRFEEIFDYARIREGPHLCRVEWIQRLRNREPAALQIQKDYWDLI